MGMGLIMGTHPAWPPWNGDSAGDCHWSWGAHPTGPLREGDGDGTPIPLGHHGKGW